MLGYIKAEYKNETDTTPEMKVYGEHFMSKLMNRNTSNYQDTFLNFISEHNKQYTTTEEFEKR